jgi:hypothetical protein
MLPATGAGAGVGAGAGGGMLAGVGGMGGWAGVGGGGGIGGGIGVVLGGGGGGGGAYWGCAMAAVARAALTAKASRRTGDFMGAPASATKGDARTLAEASCRDSERTRPRERRDRVRSSAVAG